MDNLSSGHEECRQFCGQFIKIAYMGEIKLRNLASPRKRAREREREPVHGSMRIGLDPEDNVAAVDDGGDRC